MVIVTNRTGSSQSVGNKIIPPNSSVTFTDAEIAASPNFQSDLAALTAAGIVTSTNSPIGVVSYSGAGTYVVPAGTMVVYVDPSGGVANLTLPSVNSAGTGSTLLIVQTGSGTVPVLVSGTDVLFTGSATYTMAGRGSTLALRSELPGTWRMTGRVGAPLLFECYVDLAGNDANVGTLASPILTTAEAIRRANNVSWLTTGSVYYGAGTHTAPSDIVIPGGGGPSAQPLELVGTVSLAALTGTVVSSVAGSTTTGVPMAVTLSGTLVASAQVGNVLRFTNGTLAGTGYGIFENTTNVVTAAKWSASVPTNGDAYAIDQQTTILNVPSALAIRAGSGNGLTLSRMTVSGTLTTQDCFLTFDRVHRIGFGSHAQNTSLSLRLNEYGALFSSPLPGSFAGLLDVDTANLSNVGLRSCSVQVNRGTLSIFQGFANGLSRIAVTTSGSTISRFNGSACTVSGGTNFVDVIGGGLTLSNATISGTVGGSAVACTSGGSMTITALVGTGNAGSAVIAGSGGRIRVTDANTGTTIAGATAVKVGGNAATTWALVAGGLTANVSDVGAASTQMCYVGP